jgi:hypothetical protein
MRILLTADPELPVPPQLYGGIERIIDLLVTRLQARGHTVGLVAHRDSISPAHQRFPWPGLRSQDKFDALQNTAALWSAVQQFQPDLVHSFFPHPLSLTAFALIYSQGNVLPTPP